jgi:hypothetical protein
MILNVGVTQTVADGQAGSRGASINLQVELDSSLASDSDRLKERIRQLFILVRQSVTEELAAGRSPVEQPEQPAPPSPPLNGRNPNDGRKSRGLRPATPAQVKTLLGIARRRRVNLRDLIHERCGVERPEDLSVDQASETIEALTSSSNSA